MLKREKKGFKGSSSTEYGEMKKNVLTTLIANGEVKISLSSAESSIGEIESSLSSDESVNVEMKFFSRIYDINNLFNGLNNEYHSW